MSSKLGTIFFPSFILVIKILFVSFFAFCIKLNPLSKEENFSFSLNKDKRSTLKTSSELCSSDRKRVLLWKL